MESMAWGRREALVSSADEVSGTKGQWSGRFRLKSIVNFLHARRPSAAHRCGKDATRFPAFWESPAQ